MRTLQGSRCFWAKKKVRVIVLCSLRSRSLMSLLNIPHCSSQQIKSSPTCSRWGPSASTTFMGTSFRENPAIPLAGVECLADWLTQLQIQVMSPTPTTSSATWTQRTRRSISQTATTISSAKTTQPCSLHHKILERKVNSAVREEMMAQRKLYEAEAEVEARNWEKRNSESAFQEIHQEFESQRFQPHQASQIRLRERQD